MDFRLTEEQQMVREMVRELADEWIGPRAHDMDMNRRPPLEHVAQAQRAGSDGADHPRGVRRPGAGRPELRHHQRRSRAASAPRTATTIGAHCSLCSYPIMLFGTPEQKQEWLPKLASGEVVGSFGLTEPDAGSDAAGIRTTAVPDGQGNYVINGSKQWITNGSFANVIILLANTNPAKGLMGITPFVVPYDTPGFERGAVEDTMGIRGSQQSVLNFKDMVVPEACILGGKRNIGRGFMCAMKTLDTGRIGVAAMAVGMAQGAFEKAVEFVKTREQFGKSIKQFQGLQWYLAEMVSDIYAGRDDGLPRGVRERRRARTSPPRRR